MAPWSGTADETEKKKKSPWIKSLRISIVSSTSILHTIAYMSSRENDCGFTHPSLRNHFQSLLWYFIFLKELAHERCRTSNLIYLYRQSILNYPAARSSGLKNPSCGWDGGLQIREGDSHNSQESYKNSRVCKPLRRVEKQKPLLRGREALQ